MTKFQCRKKSEIQISNSEREGPRPGPAVGRSRFVIISTFVIRISSFSMASLRGLLRNYERPQIRLPPIAEKPRLRRRRCAHARSRHWGEHVSLQRGPDRVAPDRK